MNVKLGALVILALVLIAGCQSSTTETPILTPIIIISDTPTPPHSPIDIFTPALSPASTPTTSPLLPTSTTTATPRPILETDLPPSPTITANIKLSRDVNNPTEVKWEDLFSTRVVYTSESWQGFGDEAVGWEEIPRWVNPSTGRLGINQMSVEVLNANIEKLGFVRTTSPEGVDYLMIVQAVKGNDGRVAYLKFPVNPDANPHLLDRNFDLRSVLVPMVYMSEPKTCPSWTTDLPCIYDPKLYQAMEEFLATGNVPVEMELHPLMSSDSV